MEKQNKMQQIWKEILGLSDIPGLDESFFDLGGNSFLAAKVIDLYYERVGDQLEISDFYERETIAELIS